MTGIYRWGMKGAVIVSTAAVDVARAAQGAVTDSGIDVTALLRLTIGLAVVIAAIVGVSWLLRRMQGRTGGAGGQLRVLGALAVGNRERIVLVRAGKTQLLVGVAPGRVQRLLVLEEPIDAQAAPGSDAQYEPFAGRLRRLRAKNEQ